MSESRLQNLREKLAQELQKDNPDNSVILQLSSEISKADESSVRFTVDAAVIDRLGKELVGKQETAVAELVKNSYDADATTCDLIFENTNDVGGRLTIEDDGNGMNKQELVNGFMRISSSDKVHNPVSPKYRRQRAGRKGIGRFSTQRLARELVIFTQKEDSEKAYEITINWDDYSLDKELSLITNEVHELPKVKDKYSFTKLTLNNLRENFTTASLKRIYRYVSDLQQPFGLIERENTGDPGFVSRIYRSINNDLEIIADEETLFYENALATIEVEKFEKGLGKVKLVSEKLDLKDDVNLDYEPIISEEEDDELRKIDEEHIGDDSSNPFKIIIDKVKIKIYYFIVVDEYVPKSDKSSIQRKLRESGGIRVYRNGFRILPYGDRLDDWIRLDESVRKRYHIFPHGNNNFLGVVELNDPNSDVFIERSSREGLVDNEAFRELVSLIYRAIIWSGLKIAAARSRKGKAGKDNRSPQEKFNSVKSSLSRIADDFEKEGNPTAADNIRTNIVLLDEGIKQGASFERDLLGKLEMYRVLAGLGLTIGDFTHEINHFLPSLLSDSNSLIQSLKNQEESVKAKRLYSNLDALETYTSYFNYSISQNVRRDKRPIEVRTMVNQFIEITEYDRTRMGTKLLEPQYSGYNLYTVPMHPSEWSSILLNFYSNSKKAIKKAMIKGALSIKSGKDGHKIFLEFQDNGIGIAEENKDQIFDEFFTTSAPVGHRSNPHEELVGSGLGLSIVHDIVTSYNGNVFVTEPDEEFKTNIRIEIPAASEEQLKDYDL